MTPETYEDLSAVILAADVARLWAWAVSEGLAEGAERDDFADTRSATCASTTSTP